MNLTIEQNKLLIRKFPFLLPRNVWTDKLSEDYDYTYIKGIGEVPEGWERLFLLYCKNMRKELIKYNYLDDFRFTQIKEKYGSMRLYNNGIPKDSNCDNLEYIYDHLSTYVCEYCGNPAKYISKGWVTQFCKECFVKSFPDENPDKTYFKKGNKKYKLIIHGFRNREEYKEEIPCKEYWDEYIKCLKMNDEQFLNYIIED